LITVQVVLLLSSLVCADDVLRVGPTTQGTIVPTQQLIRPAGTSVEYKGRPVDLALSPDGKTVYVKSNKSLLTIDAGAWKIRNELPLPGAAGGSMHGIAVSPDGRHVYVTASGSMLLEAAVGAD